MSVSIRIKKGRYYLDIYHNGRRTWEKLGLTVAKDPQTAKDQKQLVETIKAKRELQLVSGQWGMQDKFLAKMTLYEYIKKIGEKKKHKDRMKKVLKWLEAYPGGASIQLGQVTHKWFMNFQDYLEKESGLANITANTYAIAIRQALKQAVMENILLSDPSTGIKGISVPDTEYDYLELAELLKLAKVDISGDMGAEIKRAFLFACYCALRISDIKSLKWKDVTHTTTGAQIVKQQVKTKKRVAVPLHESAWSLINDGAIHNSEDKIFPLLAATNTDQNRNIITWTKKAGITKHITWHSARRTCPTLLHELGVDIYTIQKICGHTKTSTTAKYTSVSDQKLREAVNTLPKLEMDMQFVKKA